MEFDLVIFGGIVIDGSGAEPRVADVAIVGDTIALIGEIRAGSSTHRRIDGRKLYVAPGFIDVHTHSDYNLLACPTADSKIHQGVTTEILGNCGFSAFPLQGEILERERQEIKDLGLAPDWHDLASYRRKLSAQGHSPNVASFVGNGNLRGTACGLASRPPSPEVIAAQARLLEAEMQAGALGISTGLIYSPSYWADTNEIISLAHTVRRFGGIYSSHIRGEGGTLIEAVDEACRVGESADVPVQISHLKASGSSNWGKVAQALQRIEASSSDDRWVRFDKYPYIASSTGFSALLPCWVHDGSPEEMMARVSDPLRRGELIAHAGKELKTADGWEGILISDAASEQYRKLQGFSVADAAHQLKTDPGSLWLDLLIASRCSASMVAFTQSQEETDLVLEHPWAMVGSDAGCRVPSGPLGRANPHPRAYGTFPRYLRRYVVEKRTLTIAEATRKITSLPAAMFGLQKRGLVRAGYCADLVIFDLDRVRDRATFAQPHQFPEGIEYVLINGKVTVAAGAHTGEKAGRFLARGSSGQ